VKMVLLHLVKENLNVIYALKDLLVIMLLKRLMICVQLEDIALKEVLMERFARLELTMKR